MAEQHSGAPGEGGTSHPQGSPAGPQDAAAMAAEALQTAQQAVSGLTNDVARAGGAAPSDREPNPVDLPVFAAGAGASKLEAIDLLSDVNLNVKIELGRTRMLVEDVLRLGEGSVVELDKLAGDPVDVFVNDRHVARGEVLVLNDNFCVRINEILSPTVEGAKPTPAAPAPVKAVA